MRRVFATTLCMLAYLLASEAALAEFNVFRWGSIYGANDRSFKTGCNGPKCAIVIPFEVDARPTSYLQIAIDWVEGCYGTDEICAGVDRVISEYFGIPAEDMEEAREIYRRTGSEMIRRVAGDGSTFTMTVSNPSGYTSCQIRWFLPTVTSGGYFEFSPRDSAVQLKAVARTNSDEGEWAKGIVEIIFIESALYQANVRSGDCGYHTTDYIRATKANASGSHP